MLTESASQRLITLTPRLQRKARAIAYTSPEHNADDIFQHMILFILNKAASDVAFLDQSDAYIVQISEWRARTAADASRIYSRYVDCEWIIQDDEGDEISSFDLIPDNSANPEDIYIETERLETLLAIVRTLSPANQEIVKLFYQDYTQVEIAERLGLSKPAITQRKTTIARALDVLRID